MINASDLFELLELLPSKHHKLDCELHKNQRDTLHKNLVQSTLSQHNTATALPDPTASPAIVKRFPS